MISLRANAPLRVFHDGLLMGSGLGSLDVAMSDTPRIMRVCVFWDTCGVAAEISWDEISRARAEIRAGALSIRVTGEVISLADRFLARGEVRARLAESQSRDVVHLGISRLGVLLTEIEISRGTLDGLIALLAELDG